MHQLIPKATLELDRTRVWCFDMNATIALMRELGPTAFARLEKYLTPPDPKATEPPTDVAERMRTGLIFIWCGLVSDDPKLTLADVGRMFTIATIGPAIQQILPAWEGAMPEPIEKSEGESERPLEALAPEKQVAAG